jgi:hypothetical protein
LGTDNANSIQANTTDTTNEPIADLAITMPRLIALATANKPTIPDRYKGKPRDMVTAIWVGREMGLLPMEAINSLYLVNGAVGMSGKVMSALIHRAGHRISVALSSTVATVKCFRWSPNEKEMIEVGEVTFTEEDAKRAGLMGKETYQAYPQTMLAWRAISMAARIYYADVISGVGYVPEEIDVEVDVDEVETLPEGVIEGEVVELDPDTGVYPELQSESESNS